MLFEVPDRHADSVLYHVCKAEADDQTGMWDPHPNPYIRRIVELFTQRGLDRIAGVSGELNKWVGGEMFRAAHDRPLRPMGMLERWSETELGLVRLYLQSLPVERFAFDDWALLVDYLVQRYLPIDDLVVESAWLATRSALLGRMAAARAGGGLSQEQADTALAALPASAGAAAEQWGASGVQSAIMAYGEAHCAESVVALTDGMRHALHRSVTDFARDEMLTGAGAARQSLQSRLIDNFGTWNRDWRRIAVTESGESANQGLISSLAPGRKVKRVEKYHGACSFCRAIDGRVLEIVAADASDKNWESQVWVGKTNIGRAASARKRSGSGLIAREPNERWIVPAGVVHPNCRGSWVVMAQPMRQSDEKLSEWMDEVLGRK